jgi:hypothetical protein
MMNSIKKLLVFVILVAFGALPLSQYMGISEALFASFFMLGCIFCIFFIWNYWEIRKLNFSFPCNVISAEQSVPLSYLKLRENRIKELSERLKKRSIKHSFEDNESLIVIGPNFFRYKLQIVNETDGPTLKCSPVSRSVIFGGYNSLKIVSYLRC